MKSLIAAIGAFGLAIATPGLAQVPGEAGENLTPGETGRDAVALLEGPSPGETGIPGAKRLSLQAPGEIGSPSLAEGEGEAGPDYKMTVRQAGETGAMTLLFAKSDPGESGPITPPRPPQPPVSPYRF